MFSFFANLFKKKRRVGSEISSARTQPLETEVVINKAIFPYNANLSTEWLAKNASWIYPDSSAIDRFYTESPAAVEYPGYLYDEIRELFVPSKMHNPTLSARVLWEDVSSKLFDLPFFGRENESTFPATAVQVEQDQLRLEEQKLAFSKQLLLLFENTDFEYGIKNEVDDFVEEFLTLNSTQTKEWLECLYLENFDKTAILVKLLRTIARIDYDTIFPQGQVIATSALNHEDIEVRECGVRAFESWASLDSLNILEHLEVAEEWLQDYINEVVEYLKRDFDVPFRTEN